MEKADGIVAPAAAPAAVVKNARRFKSCLSSALICFIFLLTLLKRVPESLYSRIGCVRANALSTTSRDANLAGYEIDRR
jgi:hypothetical protein